jgi:hypothetical protein
MQCIIKEGFKISVPLHYYYYYVIFFLSLLTIMFHYKIAILHAKSFLLQSPVTPINTVYIYIHCLTESSFVVKIPFTKCPKVRVLLLKIFC